MTLKDLPIGKTATVTTVGGEGARRQHFLDMGLIPKADVTMVKFAPMGDPVEVRIHGYELTLRLADAEKIEIDKIRDTITEPMRPQDARPIFHPGLGEGGKYHVQTGEPLPPGETLTFALAGNQNCGKTTLFNQLTGSNQQGHKICVPLAGPAVGDDGVELLQKCVPVIQLLGVHGASSSDGFLLSCHIPPGFARFPLPVGGKCGIIPLVMRPWRNWYTRWISVMSPQ